MVAERLPVRPVPEERPVAPVWSDVVNHLGRVTAAPAEAMLAEKRLAGLSPRAIVSARRRARPRLPKARLSFGVGPPLARALDARGDTVTAPAETGGAHRHQATGRLRACPRIATAAIGAEPELPVGVTVSRV